MSENQIKQQNKRAVFELPPFYCNGRWLAIAGIATNFVSGLCCSEM